MNMRGGRLEHPLAHAIHYYPLYGWYGILNLQFK